MEVLPVDLEAIIAIVMGVSIILIPVAGITARFALKPTVEAFARLFEHKGLEDTVEILERRMRRLETQMQSMDQSLGRIADAVEFDRELHGGRGRRDRTLSAGEAGIHATGEGAGTEPTGSSGSAGVAGAARDADGKGGAGEEG